MTEHHSANDLIQKPTLGFINVADLARECQPPDWLITDVLERATHCMVFGDPEAGKSLIVFDMLLSIATGRTWRGRKVKQGAVFYLCGEGAAGLGRRAAAWLRLHNIGDDVHVPFYTSKKPATLMDTEATEALKEEIQALCKATGEVPIVVAIDTMARNLGPGNENSAEDVGRFVQNVDTWLIEEMGCSVITSHHTGHGDKDRARGSTALPGAVDVAYRVSKTEKIIMMECTKCKDFDRLPAITCTLEVIPVGGTDSAGRAVTGATIRHDETSKYRSTRPILKGKDLQVFDVLVEAYHRTRRHLDGQGQKNSPPMIDRKHWRTECIKRRVQPHQQEGSAAWESVKRSVNRSITELSEKGHINWRPNGDGKQVFAYPAYLE